MYTKQDIKFPAGDRKRRQILERHRRACFFSAFCFALVVVPYVTMRHVAQGNKPVSQAGLMFNEDDFHWLLITAMSPNSDTFNTARHSRCSAQCREDYQQPLTCTSTHIYAHVRGYVRKHMAVLRPRSHVHTRTHPEVGQAVCSSSLAMA